MERIHLFGIRHHGPGSTRSLLAALETLQPDLLLIEGPPEASGVLALALHEAMRPPVALLIYCPENPALSAYYPFADFSPEWQAVRYGLRHQLEVRLMDLPQANQMAISKEIAEQEERTRAEFEEKLRAEPSEENQIEVDLADEFIETEAPANPPGLNLSDPLRLLAEAAGYSESEQWWDHLVESRRSPADLFTAIQEAMTALRETVPAEQHPIAARREAAMRDCLREGLSQGYQRIAVVCGAWHVPALADLSHKKEDAALLKGMPKLKVEATWVPWTFSRLTRRSGYGAGIDSPGWYNHLWETESSTSERWMIRVARLLRAEDLDVSPASIIDAVRLADALAALRGRPLPGLPELNEAALTTLCFANPLPMRLIEEKLVVGTEIGSVPAETPQAPLMRDFEREVKRLRLPIEDIERVLDLDLRKPTDLARSHLLHRLSLLEILWARNSDATLQATGRGRSGTFHEIWRLKWLPDLALQLIDAGQWGNTIASAAEAKVTTRASKADSLIQLTGLVEDVLLADLPEAVEQVMTCLQALAAVSSDIPHLMDALPPLTSVLRYGNVRKTDTRMVGQVVDGLAVRVFIGLAGACTALNDDAAGEMFERLLKVDEAFSRMEDIAAEQSETEPKDRLDYRREWLQVLERLAGQSSLHGVIAGRACRILLDRGVFSVDDAGRRLGIGLSTAAEPTLAAAWVDGFLRGSGQMLVHDNGLLGLIDAWMCSLPPDAFPRLLPLLRRTFSTFARPVRRNIGEKIRLSGSGANPTGAAAAASRDFDPARADAILPVVARLLGLQINPAHPRDDERN
jgi:hypothetical protein